MEGLGGVPPCPKAVADMQRGIAGESNSATRPVSGISASDSKGRANLLSAASAYPSTDKRPAGMVDKVFG